MLRILIATIVILLSAPLAQAAVCTVHVSDLDFGVVDAIGNAPAMSSADVSVSCDGITPGTDSITVCGNIGEGSGGAIAGVRRAGGSEGSLGFVLQAPSGNVPWGSAANPELGDPYRLDVPVSGSDATLSTHLNGLVPAGQAAASVGSYRADFAGASAAFSYAEGELDCAAPGGAVAEAPFSVSARIEANCLLETNDLDFGTAGVIGSNIDADTDLDVTCTPGTGYGITIDGGGAHDPQHRVLRSGSDTVSYGLYSNPARTAAWGTAVGETVSGGGTGGAQHLGVYGRIPPQPAAPGAYADTVVVTITY